jgi:division protein CdvB (Snf7/Vps24/ESCRT-III family)
MPIKQTLLLPKDNQDSKFYLSKQIRNLQQKNYILSKEISRLKNELIRNNKKLKLKIRNTKNKIDLLNYHIQKIRSSKFIKIWEKITKTSI